MTDELNCSDGAKMLIERMKTHPDEFRGGSARWAMVMNQMLQVRRGGVENNVMMSRRDMNALFDAFETHVMEPAMAAHVVEELMTPKAERKKVQITRPLGKSVLTPAKMQEEALKILEQEFSKAYSAGDHVRATHLLDEYDYQTTGSYDPWSIKHRKPQT